MFSSTASLLVFALGASAFDITRFDNVVSYWGQNSYGAAGGAQSGWQQRLSYYCSDDAVDVFPIAFLDVFNGTGGVPEINLANTCTETGNGYFSGTALLNCQFLAQDIETCQAAGKIVTISLGGATGASTLSSTSQAQAFADQIWNIFLGGSSSTRPFGSAVLDGVDLDIEGGGSPYFIDFINQLRTHFNGASKKYYVSGAPQCPYPDANMGTMLNGASFDMVYVQFYNNYCNVAQYSTYTDWNFGTWDVWAKTVSPNKNVKIYIGGLAAPAIGTGYVDVGTLGSIAKTMRNSFSSFGGVMLWDESQAYANGRYDQTIKNSLTAAGGTGFTYPACSAAAWASGNNYVGGSKVTYNGYIWEAKWSASDAPGTTLADTGDWVAVSACGGAAIPPSSTSSTAKSTSTSSSSSKTTSSTSSSSGPAPTGGSCAGVQAWNANTPYVGGTEVVYNGHLWTALWWQETTPPTSTAYSGWQDDGACTSSKRSSRIYGKRDI